MAHNTDFNEFVEAIVFEKTGTEYEIREWLQSMQSVQIRGYGLEEVDREEAYYAILEELSNNLMER